MEKNAETQQQQQRQQRITIALLLVIIVLLGYCVVPHHTDASLTDAKHWRVDGEPPRRIDVAAPLLPRIEIINAWYGVRGSVEETRGGQVIARLRMNALHNKGRLVLESNLDFNHFFGFDPAPNKKK
ncbi:membrane-associated protein, putative [Bodo saltans]|uniref:Membrane-associated protein, putative n=1 Tax=Bodo saltans TaxID=75058 RepID=A0A0S4IQS9_BODSA|nr:membrane-associated protein, putative [Bodo saltans]|eukprot:CUE63956.1 membrane-associated protein, putative [Bodo saltans]